MSKEKKEVKLEHISKIYINPKTKKEFYAVNDVSVEEDPFADFGDSVSIDDNFLD